MKKAFLSLALLSSMTASATDFTLYLEQSAGEKVSWEVSSLRKITFEGSNVVITKSNGETASFSTSTVSKMYFADPATGIQAVESIAGATAHVYSVNGILTGKAVVNADGSVNLSNLPKGIYVVSVNGKSFKVANK